MDGFGMMPHSYTRSKPILELQRWENVSRQKILPPRQTARQQRGGDFLAGTGGKRNAMERRRSDSGAGQ